MREDHANPTEQIEKTEEKIIEEIAASITPGIPEKFLSTAEFKLEYGNKILEITVHPTTAKIVCYIENIKTSGDKPHPTTFLFKAAKQIMQQITDKCNKQMLYEFRTGNERILAWAKTSGQEIFAWDNTKINDESSATFKKQFRPSKYL